MKICNVRTVYKCNKCESVFNNRPNFCEKCLEYDNFDESDVEKSRYTDDMSYDEFIKLAKPTPYENYGTYVDYIWDEKDKYSEMINSEKYHVYTVIDDSCKCFVVEGIRFANRVGYIFTENYVEVNEGILF